MDKNEIYVVTNRAVDDKKSGLARFEHFLSPKGPNELHLVKVTKSGNKFITKIENDELDIQAVIDLQKKHTLPIDPEELKEIQEKEKKQGGKKEEDKDQKRWYSSLQIACMLFDQARRSKKHILLYVHGYNNNMKDVLSTCYELQRLYNVMVVPFSWPANGGGIEGTAAYLSDKQDARASADALNRTIGKIGLYHRMLTENRRKILKDKADKRHPDNPLACQQYFTKLLDMECKVTINLMCHSMGNYVLKYATMPSAGASRQLVFDNICLVAADANNPGHEQWVENLQVRKRLYVLINEDDFALSWSRKKPGDEQKARLGHYLKNLIARNANYINVTKVTGIGNTHTYFSGDPVKKNKKLKALFKKMFEGESVEDKLAYHADSNFYVLK